MDSTIILDHQEKIVRKRDTDPSTSSAEIREYQEMTRPDTKKRADTEQSSGHGEGETKWKGCLVIEHDLSV